MLARVVMSHWRARSSNSPQRCYPDAVKRCSCQVGMTNLAPHDLGLTWARLCHSSGGELGTDPVSAWPRLSPNKEGCIGSKQKLQDAVHDRLEISVAFDNRLNGFRRCPPRDVGDSAFIVHDLDWPASRDFSNIIGHIQVPFTPHHLAQARFSC